MLDAGMGPLAEGWMSADQDQDLSIPCYLSDYFLHWDTLHRYRSSFECQRGLEVASSDEPEGERACRTVVLQAVT